MDSKYLLFLNCRDKTLTIVEDLNKDPSVKTLEDVALKTVESTEECLSLVESAKSEVKDKNYLVKGIEATEKRLTAQKFFYKEMLAKSKGETPQGEKDGIPYIYFALESMKGAEVQAWGKAEMFTKYEDGEGVNPYSFWAWMLVGISVMVFLKYLGVKNRKEREKAK